MLNPASKTNLKEKNVNRNESNFKKKKNLWKDKKLSFWLLNVVRKKKHKKTKNVMNTKPLSNDKGFKKQRNVKKSVS